ncbi:MAG: metallophosphoesterase family protein [Clostridia bacterium]|nr:metallophosphoesterase family protein [Clostridia bacterium]
MKRWKWFLAAMLALAALFVLLGWDTELKTVTYTVETDQLTAPVRVAVLSDLHCCDYGEGQRELLDAVDAVAPDLVVLPGDILDDTMPIAQGEQVLESLSAIYPCYYVSGNHDAFLADWVAALGVTVLKGQIAQTLVNGQTLQICGVEDPRGVGETGFAEQLDSLAQANADFSGFSLLLAHRPARIQQYLSGGYDLVLCGHAHGGQWRIPCVLNGLLAPDEGFFPKYAGGMYSFDDTTMIVSRGLARESTRVPRLYNPPELVLVELQPIS